MKLASSKKARAVIAAGSAVAIATAATWAWLFHRPFVDQEEVAAARAYAAVAVREVRAQRCPRPVLRGDAISGDGTAAFEALLHSEGRFAGCWSFLREHGDAVRGAISHSGPSPEEDAADLPEGPESEAVPDDPPAPEAWQSYAAGRPLRASQPAIERQLLDACSAVAEEAARIAAHESVCTPYSLALPEQDMMPALWLARVLAVVARDRLRRGELQEGIAWLLDAIRLGTDILRGRATAIATMIGVGAVGITLGQLEILLAMHLPWDEPTLRALEEEVVILSGTTPTPDHFVRDDAIAMMIENIRRLDMELVRRLEPNARESLEPLEAGELEGLGLDRLDLAKGTVVGLHRTALRMEPHLCRADDTRAACFGRVTRTAGGGPETVPFRREACVLGPRPLREESFDALHSAFVRAFLDYAHRVAVLDAEIRAMWIVLEHRRLTLAERPCPSAAELDAALGAIPTVAQLGGELALLPSGLPYRPIEVSGPAWLRPPGETRTHLRLPLARAYCPLFLMPDARR